MKYTIGMVMYDVEGILSRFGWVTSFTNLVECKRFICGQLNRNRNRYSKIVISRNDYRVVYSDNSTLKFWIKNNI